MLVSISRTSTKFIWIPCIFFLYIMKWVDMVCHPRVIKWCNWYVSSDCIYLRYPNQLMYCKRYKIISSTWSRCAHWFLHSRISPHLHLLLNVPNFFVMLLRSRIQSKNNETSDGIKHVITQRHWQKEHHKHPAIVYNYMLHNRVKIPFVRK